MSDWSPRPSQLFEGDGRTISQLHAHFKTIQLSTGGLNHPCRKALLRQMAAHRGLDISRVCEPNFVAVLPFTKLGTLFTDHYHRDKSKIFLETWDLRSAERVLTSSSTALSLPEVGMQSYTTEPISFSHDASNFKLGSHSISVQDFERIVTLGDSMTSRNFEPISTDIDRVGNTIVVAYRTVQKSSRRTNAAKKSLETKHNMESVETSDSDISEDSIEDSECDYSTDSDYDNSAEETCSEGSTDIESDTDDSGEEELQSDKESEDSLDTEEEESVMSEDDSSSVTNVSDSETKKQESSRQNVMFNFRQPQQQDGIQLGFEDDLVKKNGSRPTYPGMPGRVRELDDQIKASVAIYDVSSGQAVRMFHYDKNIPAMLYHSPPILHPFEPLMVWPLGGGDVLFVDYNEKTYFIRGSMPTTRDSESCQFRIF
jgi:hypothetical protein